MALHIRDDETDALVRELAAAKGVGLTEAVREAVRNELARGARRVPLIERLRPVIEEIAAARTASGSADKAFYDDLWGQAGD